MPRGFGQSESVPHRHRHPADEAGEVRIQDRPLEDVAAERIGPVEHKDGNALLGRRLKTKAQRPEVGVNARADVLQVDDQDIETLEHRLSRFSHIGVKTVHRDLSQRIKRVRRLDHVVLLLGPQAVLRSEQRRQLARQALAEDFIGGAEAGVDRRLIHHQPEPGTAQDLRRVGRANFKSETKLNHGSGNRCVVE